MKKVATRRELLDRWRGIEEEENDSDVDTNPLKRHRFHQLKEQWFADAFNFLICLPKEDHIWCGSWDLMGPLLETFYNYFRDERLDSPLKLLWKRITEEMKQCIQCVSQHHQAQEMYTMEFELSSIGPLLDVLRTLDEARVTQHLREINATIARGDYIPEHNNAEVVSVMYEVLMFPAMLDDQFLFNEFEKFIEAVDNVHELALGGHQQFPGVYALFFFKRRVRSVGYRLAGCMGKLRTAADLDPLQPLLKKFIGFLETDGFPPPLETSRPRLQLERVSVWIGVKSLLGFLQPPAFEEGILEQYPIFLDIVLNHISADSPEFSHAVSCLRLLFEMLGCKLWLRSTLSPSVMRNTLVGQCFHTRSEKNHKEILDLFPPFLQSLEALQDGEHEKQRRNFIYFLLHQVPVSSNFSDLTRKKACQIALLIVYQGYKMNPPCPPFECAHMWGPSLVASLRDPSLHSSLRQPAFDLIQTIIVSDAAALITSMLNFCKPLNSHKNMFMDSPAKKMFLDSSINVDDDVLLSTFDVKKDESLWNEFSEQYQITSAVYREWMCVPMIWIDVLVDIDPSILPVSFSKALFWARSRFSMVEPENSTEMVLPIKTWLSSSAKEVSSSFGWKVPTGSDDGGEGKESRNSVKVSAMCLPLIRTFNRLTAHLVIQMGQGDLKKQWIWEPRMGESLVLLLVDPNENVRQIGKSILEQVSNTRGLSSGLKFLCSSGSSLFATFKGLKHALILVQLDSVLLHYQTLQHFFFVLRKLLQEGVSATSNLPENSSGQSNITKFSSDGGFLRQPVFDSPATVKGVECKVWDKFCLLVSETAWPSIRKCLREGKAFINYRLCEMTCVRLLEIIPLVLEKLKLFSTHSRNSHNMVEDVTDFKWLIDLMDWGKSSLKVITVYWKRAVASLLNLFRASCSDSTLLMIRAIENLISCDNFSMDELTEKVSCLSLSLSEGSSGSVGKAKSRYVNSYLQSSQERKLLDTNVSHFSEDKEDEVQALDSVALASETDKNKVIILSDDEEQKVSPNKVSLSTDCNLEREGVVPSPSQYVLQTSSVGIRTLGNELKKDVLESCLQRDSKGGTRAASQKQDTGISEASKTPLLPKSKVAGESKHGANAKHGKNDFSSSQHRMGLQNSSDSTRDKSQMSTDMAKKADDALLKELIHDTEDDPLEAALKPVRCEQPSLPKLSIPAPRRQVIQLKGPVEGTTGALCRPETGGKRFKLPRLDDWYRSILEVDYFATVGLSSTSKSEGHTIGKLKEIPLFFQSPEQYMNIFRPLVLEELKAQLHSSSLEMSSWEEVYYGTLSVMSVERVDDFHLVRFAHEENNSASSKTFTENDLVLLTKDHPQNSSHDVHMVGKVEMRERDNKRRMNILLIRFYFQNGSLRLNQARRHLIDRSKWHSSRIMSITPQLREFQALSSIKDIPLLPVILRPTKDATKVIESKEVKLGKLSQPLQQVLVSSFNDSQLQAISISIGSSEMKKKFDLSLIQGPPGTGKTRTIVAIVSCLLAYPLQRGKDTRGSLNGCINNNVPPTLSNPRVKESIAIARAWQDAALARQLNEETERKSKSTESSTRGRVLICAQSNAAVDELISRISSAGLYGNDGKMYKPYLVRVGNAKTVHPNSLPYFIDTLVDQRLAEERVSSAKGKNEFSMESSVLLRSNLEKLVDRIQFYEAKRANLENGNSDCKGPFKEDFQKGDDGKEMSDAELGAKLRRLYEQKKQIYKDLSSAQAQEKKFNEETKALKHKLRKSILKEAEIVVTTLSGCGGDLYGVCSESLRSHKFGAPSEHTLFDAVVVDEAAQALEPATLIPFQLLKSYGTKCIMVGDPKQLPATVLSNVASKFLYQCSMFERLQRAGYPVVMLTKQYRMHPEICRFPSMHFYENKLLNGEDMSSKVASFHGTKYFGPYIFFDIIDGQEYHGKNSGSLSLYNEHEADAAVEILRFFKKRYPSEFVGGRIGIITPYKCQLSLLRSRFSSAFGSSVTADIEFNTVDGFQGREVDILLLSTVRAAGPSSAGPGKNSSSIGFVADIRRMNVALTRAKLSLWILGNARTLQSNNNWDALVMDATQRNVVISVKRPYKHTFKAEIRKNTDSERSKNCQRKLKHGENVNDSGQHSKLDGNREKEISRRKRSACGSENQRDWGTPGGQTDFTGSKEDFQTNKRKLTEEHDSSINGISESRASGDDRVARNVNYTINQHTPSGYVKEKEGSKKKDNVEYTCSGNRKAKNEKLRNNLGHSDYEVGDDNHLRSQASKSRSDSSERVRPKKNKEVSPVGSSKSGRRLKNKEASSPAVEGNCKERNMGDVAVVSNQSGTRKDIIAKRKQQREAVNALLSSALLPSKKSENSKKLVPEKRPISSTTSTSDLKLPKSRKVFPATTAQKRPDSSA